MWRMGGVVNFARCLSTVDSGNKDTNIAICVDCEHKPMSQNVSANKLKKRQKIA